MTGPFFVPMFLGGCAAQLPLVTHIGKDEASDPAGVVYALPRKHVLVTLTAVKTTVKDAPRCAAMLDTSEAKVLGLERPEYTGPKVAFTKAEWVAFAVPDPEQRYRVEVPVDLDTKTEKTTMTWQADGVVTGGGYASEDRTAAFATSLVELSARVVGAFAGFGAAPAKTVDDYCTGQLKQLARLRGGFGDLRSGTDAQSKDVLDYLEARLLADIASTEALFTGVENKVGKVVCDVDPTKAGSAVLFTSSAIARVKTSACAVPESLNLSEEEATYAKKTFDALPENSDLRKSLPRLWRWSLELDTPTFAAPAPPAPPAGRDPFPEGVSYAYRRPAPATIGVWRSRIGSDGQTVETQELQSESRLEWVPQLGSVAWLPRYNGAKVDATIAFDPATGALTSLSVAREPADPSAWTTAVGDLAEKIASQGSPEARMAELQTRQGILEATIAIRAAEEQLADE